MNDPATSFDRPTSGRVKRLIVAAFMAAVGVVVAVRLLSRSGRESGSEPHRGVAPRMLARQDNVPTRRRPLLSEPLSGSPPPMPAVLPEAKRVPPARYAPDNTRARIGGLTIAALAVILCVAAALRLALLVRGQWMIDYDEALTGLVAKHILEGRRPVFVFSVPYMGLVESYLVAALFAMAGLSREVLKAVPFIFSLAFVALTFFLAREIFNNARIALLSALLSALPPVYATVHELKAWGSTVETLVFGSLLLLIAARLIYRENTSRQKALLYIALGIVAGVAFWVNFLIAYYLLTIAVVFFWRDRRFFLRRPFLAVVPAFFVGSLPLWAYNVKYPLATFIYLLRPGNRTLHTPHVNYFAVMEHLVVSDLPHVLGVPWNWAGLMEVEWFSRAMAALAALSFVGLAVWRARAIAARRGTGKKGWSGQPIDLLLIFIPVMIVVYLVSGFGKPAVNTTGVDTSGRYLVTLFSVLPIFLAAVLYGLRRVHWSVMALGILVVVGANLYSNYVAQPLQMFQSPYYNRLPPSSEALVSYLRSNGLRYVWTDIAVGLPLMFDSREDILAADYVHDSNKGNDYFPKVRHAIEVAPTTAYVVIGLPGRKTRLEGELERLQVTFVREELSPYVVIVPLSRKVDPDEVVGGLGFQY